MVAGQGIMAFRWYSKFGKWWAGWKPALLGVDFELGAQSSLIAGCGAGWKLALLGG